MTSSNQHVSAVGAQILCLSLRGAPVVVVVHEMLLHVLLGPGFLLLDS